MRIYGQPLIGGSDEYLNELALEWNEDPDNVSASLPALVTRESLALTEASIEALADIARAATGAADADPASGAGLLPAVHPKKVLKDWWPL